MTCPTIQTPRRLPISHENDMISQFLSSKRSGAKNMKYWLILLTILTVALNGCASLMDAQFQTKDGKESPFKPKVNQHEPIQAPVYRD